VDKTFNGKQQEGDSLARFEEAAGQLVFEIERGYRRAGAVDMLSIAGEVRMLRIGFRTLVELLAKHGHVQLPEWDKAYVAAIEGEVRKLRAGSVKLAVAQAVVAPQ
jgi:hypothetical protein